MTEPRRCLRCGYSLKGLPETHRCPECGLPYDACSALVQGTGRDYFWGFFAAVCLAVIVVMVRFQDWDWRLVFFAVSMAGLAYGVRRWRVRQPEYFAFRTEGLVLFDSDIRERRTIPKSAINDIAIESIFGSEYAVAIRDRDGKQLLKLPLWRFDSREHAVEFVNAIRCQLQAGSPPDTGPA